MSRHCRHALGMGKAHSCKEDRFASRVLLDHAEAKAVIVLVGGLTLASLVTTPAGAGDTARLAASPSTISATPSMTIRGLSTNRSESGINPTLKGSAPKQQDAMSMGDGKSTTCGVEARPAHTEPRLSGTDVIRRQAISTKKAPRPAGTYSQAVRADGFVFISGQTPRLPDGGRSENLPFEAQARLALDNIEAVARASGLSLHDAVKVDVFLRDLSERNAFDKIYAKYVGDPPPSRTLVQSSFAQFDVEVSAILLDHC